MPEIKLADPVEYPMVLWWPFYSKLKCELSNVATAFIKNIFKNDVDFTLHKYLPMKLEIQRVENSKLRSSLVECLDTKRSHIWLRSGQKPQTELREEQTQLQKNDDIGVCLLDVYNNNKGGLLNLECWPFFISTDRCWALKQTVITLALNPGLWISLKRYQEKDAWRVG